MNWNKILNLQGFSFVSGCRILISQKIEGAPATGIFHKLLLFLWCVYWCLMTNNGFERFSLERTSPHGSHVEAKAEGAELGSYCFLFPRIGSRGCTLKQTLTPFLLQKVTVRHDGAGNVNKERACFCCHCYCHLYFRCRFGRSPALRCCSRGVGAARCEFRALPSLRVTSAKCHCQYSN